MITWRYSDYISVKEDFIPVYTEEEDSQRPGAWKSFIPHQPMQVLLEKLISTLERERAPNVKPLWINGAYGTGKTFGAFVVKHILEDSLSVVEEYFSRYDRYLHTLWQRFKVLRENKKFLVVYASSSAHINSNLDLLVELQQRVEACLDQKGLSVPTGQTLIGEMISKLEDSSSVFNWGKAFEKFRNKFMQYPSPDSVIRALKELPPVQEGCSNVGNTLVQAVYQVFQAEGIAIVTDADRFKRWVEDVLQCNKGSLDGILFIWDEFTDYFIRNERLGWLQEIAHLSAKVPFYLFLVTHRTVEQMVKTKGLGEDYTKLLDRFHFINFEMTDVTAYELISNAIVPLKGKEDEWEVKKETLWNKVSGPVLALKLIEREAAPSRSLKDLLPLHPFSAYLLSLISKQFTSSERTLFKFLTQREDASFNWFISNNPTDEMTLLYTADLLWDYFFRSGELLLEEITELVSYSELNLQGLESKELKQVFKAALLIIAISKQVASEKLQPKLSLLQKIFGATRTDAEKALRVLCERGLLNTYEETGDKRFFLPLMSVDKEKLKQIKIDLMIKYRFNDVVKDELGKLVRDKFIEKEGPEKEHALLVTIPLDELLRNRDRILTELNLQGYQVGLVFILCQDSQQVDKAVQFSRALSVSTPKVCYLVTQIPFGNDEYGKWLDLKARAKYAESLRDVRNHEYFEKQAKLTLETWVKNMSEQGTFQAFFRGRSEQLTGVSGYRAYFGVILDEVFPYRPEKVFHTITLYRTSGYGRAQARWTLMPDSSCRSPYKEVIEALQAQGFLGKNLSGYTKNPNHFLSVMKNQVVDKEFSSNSHVYLHKVWLKLTQEPFGLFPCGLSMVIMACLLQDYVEGYYWFDGTNSHRLNPDRLTEIVEAVVKKGAEWLSIRRVSPIEERFCSLLSEIFHLGSDVSWYYKEIRKHLRVRMQQMGYPLWSLTYLELNPDLKRILNVLSQLIQGIDEEDSGNVFERGAQDIVPQLQAMKDDLRKLVNTKSNYAQGFRQFIHDHFPEVGTLITQMNVPDAEITARLKIELMEDPWLWHEEKVNEVLPNIRDEYSLVLTFSFILKMNITSLDKAIEEFLRTYPKRNLPLVVFIDAASSSHPKEIDVLKAVLELSKTGYKYQGKYELAKMINECWTSLSHLLDSEVEVLCEFVQKQLGVQISPDDARDFLSNMDSSYRTGDLPRVREFISTQIAKLERVRLEKEVYARWQRLTQSSSPEEWSERQRIPINWVLTNDEDLRFINSFGNIHKLAEPDLRAMSEYLNSNSGRLIRLGDPAYVDASFIRQIAGDFPNILANADVDDLKEHLFEKMESKVSSWTNKPGKLRDFVKDWVNTVYEERVYPKVAQLIRTISEQEAKRILEELAHDPVLGERLIKISLGGAQK